MSENLKLKRNLLLLEINEIPWEVIDKFIDHPDLLNIKRFFKESKTYTTVVDGNNHILDNSKLVKGISKEGKEIIIDSGELSPWVTWPTFHRGITSKEHCIRFLGQDISTFKGKPIWEEFLDRGYSVGICGSLQSWPPRYPGKNGFYIPDCFARDEKCYPEFVEPFQRFNLEQVQKNGLVVREKSLYSSNLISLILTLPGFISFDSFVEITKQLLQERINNLYVARRTAFQGVLLWDIFKKLYRVKEPPVFSTFFTNHVASVLHRYWHHIFPEDFGEMYRDFKKIHYTTILFSLKIVDKVIGDAISLAEINPDITLIFATSMGQEAIRYTDYEGYSAELEDVSKLFNVFNIKQSDYKPLLAMVPQVTVQVSDNRVKDYLFRCLNNCFSLSGKKLFTFEEAGKTISITIHTPSKEDIVSNELVFKQDGVEKKFSWSSCGIKMHKLEEATGYHKKEGVLALWGKDIKQGDPREKIKLSSVKNLLLDLVFGEKQLKVLSK